MEIHFFFINQLIFLLNAQSERLFIAKTNMQIGGKIHPTIQSSVEPLLAEITLIVFCMTVRLSHCQHISLLRFSAIRSCTALVISTVF